jgi:hypothetical protein
MNPRCIVVGVLRHVHFHFRNSCRTSFFCFGIILHSSYIAYGMSAIFATTSMASKCAPASVFYCTILLAVPSPPSRHSFWAQCPPYFPVAVAMCSPPHSTLLSIASSSSVLRSSRSILGMPIRHNMYSIQVFYFNDTTKVFNRSLEDVCGYSCHNKLFIGYSVRAVRFGTSRKSQIRHLTHRVWALGLLRAAEPSFCRLSAKLRIRFMDRCRWV